MYSSVIRVITILILSNPLLPLAENEMNLQWFNNFYAMEYPEITHVSGYSFINNYKIATHYYKPENPLGTVLVVHGYYDHVGIEKNLIASLLENQFSVVAYDLPGHGLSSGERADIDDFHDYTSILIELIEIVSNEFNPPYHLIGHSTGGAIIIDGLLQNEFNSISKVILVSPLIHSNYWKISRVGNWIADIFTDELPRVFRKNSSHREYLDFIKHRDPLQYKKVPLNWFKSLVEWNRKISTYGAINREVLVIQGDRDITVDWKYNLEFVQDKIPDSLISIIEGGNHQLYNESELIRTEVFEEIRVYLDSF